MDNSVKSRLAELGRLSLEGMFGDAVQAAAQDYSATPLGTAIFIKVVHDFYQVRATDEDGQIAQVAELFCRLLIVVYRDARKRDGAVADAFVNAFLKDYPGVQGSCLFSKWEALGRASLAFKAASRTNPVLAWEQAKGLVQAYNEFLNGLLGFLIIGWRCALGRPISPQVLGNPYGAKRNEFSQLTGGEDGAFYLICRLARPDLRNAIAHGSIWLETAAAKVKYTDRDRIHEMELIDLIGLAAVGSHLAQAYLVALAAIVLLVEGSSADVAQLPQHLVQLFNHR